MEDLLEQKGVRPISIKDKWCVHAYYTMDPYAPDGSGRILYAGTDLKTNRIRIYIASKSGEVLDEFGDGIAETSFYHTGAWQTWSKDSRYVYYQGGTMAKPLICRYDTVTRTEIRMEGDMEGAPPFDEPIISGYLGMLYAAGYGSGIYAPQNAPVPFENRDEHGLFKFNVAENKAELALSINQILDLHPNKQEILKSEQEYIAETGNKEGYTLMAYCVRWNRQGDRCLFYFGNHAAPSTHKEPILCYIFTADKELKDIRLALDLSFGRRKGGHWSWHPDGKRLVGYATTAEKKDQFSVCTVNYDGTDFKKISDHDSGGHVSICPTDYHLLLTDESTNPGRVVFINLTTDTEVGSYILPRVNGEKEVRGRNPMRVCHHPVFSGDGKTVIVNTMFGNHAQICEVDTIGRSKE